MSIKRVRLTNEEHTQLLLAAGILHFNPPYTPWSAALQQLNSKAPEGRRLGRGTIYTKSLRWLKELQSYPKDLYINQDKLNNNKIEEYKEPEKITQTNLDKFLEEFSTKVSDQLFERIKEKLETKLKEYEASYTNPALFNKINKPKEKEFKRKILIVGLLPIQQQEVTKSYGEIFKLRYHESDENVRRLKDRVEWSDSIILNCTKISHSSQDMVKKFAENREVKLVFGGTSGIKGSLEGIKLQCLAVKNR